MFRDRSLPERCRSSISAHLQLQLHSNSHNIGAAISVSHISPLHLGKKVTNKGLLRP